MGGFFFFGYSLVKTFVGYAVAFVVITCLEKVEMEPLHYSFFAFSLSMGPSPRPSLFYSPG